MDLILSFFPKNLVLIRVGHPLYTRCYLSRLTMCDFDWHLTNSNTSFHIGPYKLFLGIQIHFSNYIYTCGPFMSTTRISSPGTKTWYQKPINGETVLFARHQVGLGHVSHVLFSSSLTVNNSCFFVSKNLFWCNFIYKLFIKVLN